MTSVSPQESLITQAEFLYDKYFLRLLCSRTVTNVTLTNHRLLVQSQKKVLGLIPRQPKNAELPLSVITGAQVTKNIDWTWIIAGGIFVVIGLLGTYFPILIGALLIWLAFDSNIVIANQTGKSVVIPSTIRDTSEKFAQAVNSAVHGTKGI